MAVHKGPASLRPRCTRSGSSVAAIQVYQSTILPVYQSTSPLSSSGVFSSWILAGKESCFWHVDKTWEWQILAWPSREDARKFPNTFVECRLVIYCWFFRDSVFEASLGCDHSIEFHVLSDIICSIWVQILALKPQGGIWVWELSTVTRKI
jgi:hypothetical protein